MLESSKKLFEGWNDNNIRYFHWKSNEHLQDGLDGKTDVDVYIYPEDKKQGEKVLEETGYIKFIPQKGSRYPDVDEWIGFDYNTGNLIHIHLHYALITGKKHVKEYILPWGELSVILRVKDDETGVYIASPDLEIITLFTRMVLKTPYGKKVTINNDYAAEISYLRQRIDGEKLKQLCMLLYTNYGEKIFEIINKESLSQVEIYLLKRYVKAELKPCIKMPTFLVFIKHYYYKYSTIAKWILSKKTSAAFINRKIAAHQGISICFIGADGSGKSTISSDISKWLNWKIECKKFYLGSGEHYRSLFRTLTRIASKIIKHRKVSKVGTKEVIKANTDKTRYGAGVRNKAGVLKKAFYAMQAIEFIKIANRTYKQLKKANAYQTKGGIAIYDRFPQTQFDGIYDGPKIESCYRDYINKWIFKTFAKRERILLEKAKRFIPTIVIKLLVSPEVSIERKPDHDYSEIKKKVEITERLNFEGSIVYNIDAAQPYDWEVLEVKRIIWEAISNQS